MIKIGDSFQNYEALCNALEVTPLKGRSKQNQLKHWETFFSYKIEKKRWIITQVFKTFAESESLPERERKQREGIFLQDLSLQILNNLAEEVEKHKTEDSFRENRCLVISLEEDLITYGFCHENYKKAQDENVHSFLPEEYEESVNEYLSLNLPRKKESFLAFMKEKGVALSSENGFFETRLLDGMLSEFKEKGRSVFNSTLTNLASRHFITYKATYLILEKGSTIPRLATDEELNTIEDTTVEVLKKFKLKTVTQIFERGLQKAFYAKRAELLSKEQNWSSCRRAYKLLFTENQIDFASSYRKSLSDNLSARERLNQSFYFYFTSKYDKKSLSPPTRATAFNIIEYVVKGKDVFA